MPVLAGNLGHGLALFLERQSVRPGLQPRICHINVKLRKLGHASLPLVRGRLDVLGEFPLRQS
eukprot:4560353-Pyramimonas_sp.AAC.1